MNLRPINKKGLERLEGICERLDENDPSLTSIKFGRLDWINGDFIAKVIGQSLKSNTTLKSLDLSHNDINSICEISEVLETNSSLRYLNLSHNKLNTEEISSLFKAINENSNSALITLDISWNSHPNEHVMDFTAIADVIKNNRTLSDINLSGVRLYDNAKNIADSLKSNTTLNSLSLKSCNIYDSQPLVIALKENMTLMNLAIDGNKFTNLEIKKIKSYIDRNITLNKCKIIQIWYDENLYHYHSQTEFPDIPQDVLNLIYYTIGINQEQIIKLNENTKVSPNKGHQCKLRFYTKPNNPQIEDLNLLEDNDLKKKSSP